MDGMILNECPHSYADALHHENIEPPPPHLHGPRMQSQLVKLITEVYQHRKSTQTFGYKQHKGRP